MTTPEQYARTMARQQAHEQGAAELAAQTHTISGEFLVVGAGEVKNVDVRFPVTFIAPPSFMIGFRVPEGAEILSGQFPQATGAAYNFIIEERLPSSRLYKGCSIGVVINGPIGTKMIANWSFTGVGLTNPMF